jgi:hypothetical protein
MNGTFETVNDVEQKNKSLRQISHALYGESVLLEIVNPNDLCLLKQNARFFKKEAFKQLVANIKSDKRLSSIPLCRRMEENKLEVLSGNHRVKAAIEAGLTWIMVMVLCGDLSNDERLAIQLSHNALAGQDDPQILAKLWSTIEDIKSKLYAGLSSDTMKELEQIKLVTFSTPAIYTKSLTFVFTEHEKEYVEAVVTELSGLPPGEKYIFPMEQFDDFFSPLQNTKRLENIKNGSLAILKLIELAEAVLHSKKEKDQCLS